jgi:MinD superfamily P-loop ATPase
MHLPYDGLTYRGWTIYVDKHLCMIEAQAAIRDDTRNGRVYTTDVLCLNLTHQDLSLDQACTRLVDQLKNEVDHAIIDGAPGHVDAPKA